MNNNLADYITELRETVHSVYFDMVLFYKQVNTMSNKRGNYARHAFIWDREGRDRSDVIEFYSKLTEKYGHKVLSLMCAVGTIACGMAEKGFSVTAVDIEPEMITIAKKNNQGKSNPVFIVGDVTNLSLPDNDRIWDLYRPQSDPEI